MRRLLLTLAVFLLLSTPAQASWSWPVRGEVITSYRNSDDPYAAGQHRGIDIAAPVATPVSAAASGEVLFAGTAGSSGLTVSVRTGDGFDTSYLHLSSIAVRAGSSVSAGDRLGAVGTSGTRSAVQPHLHFGVREAGTRHTYVDPLSMLPPATAPPPSEAPRPTPVPAPAPLAPVPEPAPAPREAPRPVPAPRAVPRPAPTRLRAQQPAPAAQPIPIPRLAPTPSSVHPPKAVPAPRGAPLAAPLRVRPAATVPVRIPSRPATSSSPTPASGPDLGWALACAGLLLAAGVLGLTDDGRRAAARGRSRIGGALRPLLGRR